MTMKEVELCTNAEYVARDAAPEGWQDEFADVYTSAAVDAINRDPRAGHLSIENAKGQRILFHGWNGAHFTFRTGLFGTFEDLTADEKASLEAGDAAGFKAATEWAAELESAEKATNKMRTTESG